jgi:hypothetical protein
MRLKSSLVLVKTQICVAAFALSMAIGFACSWQPSLTRSAQPSVLVLMVENLGFNAFSCGDSSAPPDDVLFESFCEESVRFTHAYTPSTMSQATIASLLTGLYPREHGVRHNGPQGLSAKQVTIAEVAKAAHFKTSFFSGGPPIFRRSGFSQGFDIFDDNIGLTLKNLYRPALNIINLFLDWQKSSAPAEPFVSFLYFADPQFIDQPTIDDVGEVRESSYEGQIAEVSESIETLVKEMKHRKIWDTTTVILVGLNGVANDVRSSEPGAVNLFGESTRTVLMVKPAHEARPEYVKPSNWKIDSNVSLVDVGETLQVMLSRSGSSVKSRVVSKMGTVSLLSAFFDPKPNWADDREIVVESAWPLWRGIGGIRSALRKGPYFYLFDENDQIFNTLTDNLEFRSLPLGEPGASRLRDQFAQFLRANDYSPWRIVDRADLDRTLLGQELWRDRLVSEETANRLKALTNKYKGHRELIGWRANVDLQRADWADLKVIATKERPLWAYVADANLNAKIPPLIDLCLKALFAHIGERGKDCGDELSRSLALWADETKPRKDRDKAMDTFNKLEISKALSDRVSRTNLTVGDVWDVSRGPWTEPSLTDLMLAMPDMKKFRVVRSRKNESL